MADFSLKLAPQVILGPDVVNRLSVGASCLAERCLLVVDPALNEAKAVDRVKELVEAGGTQTITFDEIPESAGSTVAEDIINLARGSRVQSVLGLGGVRTLSIARAVAMTARESLSLDDLLDGKPPTGPGLPFIALPTSYRDPFLYDETLAISDSRSRSIRVLKTQENLTKLVLIDPDLTNSISPKVSALICFELILQAIEGYISLKASFFSDDLFEKAIQLAFAALDGFIEKPDDPANRLNAAQSAFLSGFGFASSSAGIGTALSLSINARNHIPKSSLSTIFLPYVMESAMKSRVEKMAKVAALSGEETSALNPSEAATRAIDGVRRRLGQLRLPTRLKDFDLKLDSLVELAGIARNLEMCSYLPRTYSVEEVYDLVKQAF
jgi:alcohol dehydrogenase